MELFKASNQWMTRPDDERFSSLKEMHAACDSYRKMAAEATVPQATLRVEPTDRGLALVGKTGAPATMTHWAFGQLCTRMHAPADYLRTLSPEIAAGNLNYCLKDAACGAWSTGSPTTRRTPPSLTTASRSIARPGSSCRWRSNEDDEGPATRRAFSLSKRRTR